MGEPRNLIVDTGLNRPECLRALRAGMRQLGVDLERTDFFITHMHSDHFALTSQVVGKTSRVFFNRPEAEIVEAGFHWEPMIAYGGLNGFPRAELEAALNAHPGFKHGSTWMPYLNIIEEGEPMSVGDYHFTCLITPGHTLGHTCLWEAERKILIAGDHILGDITPNIQCWRDGFDPLAMYLESLDKTTRLDAQLVLPGHRSLIQNIKERIGQLKEHHHLRLEEIRGIMSAAPRDAYQTAAHMSWDINCSSWEEFPVAQKWFATGEAMAHLRYLENRGEVMVTEESGQRIYGPAI